MSAEHHAPSEAAMPPSRPQGPSRMSHNANPLIGTTNGDTIEETRAYVRWLLQVMDSDGQTERGVICSLRLVLGAVDSLGLNPDAEKTQH